jgi:High potential iron-sulfur protein
MSYRLTRRGFLGQVAAAVPVASVIGLGELRADGLPHLAPDEPAAKALLYAPDVAGIDKKNPLAAKFKPGQSCANCAQINAATGDWRPCKIFPGKLVSAKGWCSVWAAKT